MIWKQDVTKQAGEFVAEMVFVQQDGKYLVDHVTVFYGALAPIDCLMPSNSVGLFACWRSISAPFFNRGNAQG